MCFLWTLQTFSLVSFHHLIESTCMCVMFEGSLQMEPKNQNPVGLAEGMVFGVSVNFVAYLKLRFLSCNNAKSMSEDCIPTPLSLHSLHARGQISNIKLGPLVSSRIRCLFSFLLKRRWKWLFRRHSALGARSFSVIFSLHMRRLQEHLPNRPFYNTWSEERSMCVEYWSIQLSEFWEERFSQYWGGNVWIFF